jgi:CheY-like chemotaxis protein
MERQVFMSQSVAGDEPQRPTVPNRQTKVLVVDDDYSVRESLALALRSENFQVVTAANGQEALERYLDGYVDLVLLDLHMPVKNGWDTFERLTALNPYLAIILITSRLNQREMAAVAGASALMEKPLNVPLLIQTINRLVEEPIEVRLERIAAHRPLVLSDEGQPEHAPRTQVKQLC